MVGHVVTEVHMSSLRTCLSPAESNASNTSPCVGNSTRCTTASSQPEPSTTGNSWLAANFVIRDLS